MTERCGEGLSPGLLASGLVRMERWPGVRKARRAVDFLDARSESVGESVSRVRLHVDGLPAPELQQEILGPDGRVVARVDFLWKEQRTVGRVRRQGQVRSPLNPGQDSRRGAGFDEKTREDLIRDCGLQVARWIWRDFYRPGVIRDRVLRAFARSSPSRLTRAYPATSLPLVTLRCRS